MLQGNNLNGAQHVTIYGLNVSPAGLRMMWNDHGTVKPYYEIKGGIIAFTRKLLSQHAAYEISACGKVSARSFA